MPLSAKNYTGRLIQKIHSELLLFLFFVCYIMLFSATINELIFNHGIQTESCPDVSTSVFMHQVFLNCYKLTVQHHFNVVVSLSICLKSWLSWWICLLDCKLVPGTQRQMTIVEVFIDQTDIELISAQWSIVLKSHWMYWLISCALWVISFCSTFLHSSSSSSLFLSFLGQ